MSLRFYIFDNEDHAFERTVVMCAGFGVGVDRYGPGPDLLCADPCEIDGRLPVHAGSLRRVGIELRAGHNPHAIMLPSVFLVRMVVHLHVSDTHAQSIIAVTA